MVYLNISVIHYERVTSILSKRGYPKVNILEKSECLEIEAAISGLLGNQVNVEWKDDKLTISYHGGAIVKTVTDKTNLVYKTDDRIYKVRELHKSNFSRTFYVPEDGFKVNNIIAQTKEGILTIIIPKKEIKVDKKQSQKINIITK